MDENNSKTCDCVCICNYDEDILKSDSKEYTFWKKHAKRFKQQADDWKAKCSKANEKHKNLLKRQKVTAKKNMNFQKAPKLAKIAYESKSLKGKKQARARIRAAIKKECGLGMLNMVNALRDLVFYLRKRWQTYFFEQLDLKSITLKNGGLKFPKPLTFFCYQKVNEMALQMENDPLILTTLYVLRRELELGESKASLICRMLFREGSNSESGVNFENGRFRYRPNTYGWNLDQRVAGLSIGITFPRLSVNSTSNKVAKEYIRKNCTIMPKVLDANDLYALGLDRSIDVGNVAVINISEACELLAKLEVEVLWREFSWFKDMGQEGCPTDFGLFVRMLGVDCFPLYQGFFSKKAVTAFSMSSANTPGLLHRPEFCLPLALIEGTESDPKVQAVMRVLDKHYILPIQAKTVSYNFNSPAGSTVRADKTGALMTGDVEIRHRFETRSDQAGLPKWLKCAPPGARYGICGAQVHKDNLKTWEVMISHVNSKYTAAFIEFDDRQKMSQHFVDRSEELRDQYPSNDAIINVLLDEAAKNVTFGGNSQVYGLPFHFMYFWLLCVLHIDNNECKTFLLALLDASVRRFQKRKDVLTSTDIDRLDFDSLDVYFMEMN